MAKRKQKAGIKVAAPAATAFADLLRPSVLPDSEVYASLEQELERERTTVHAEMCGVIREGSRKVARLASSIFGPICELIARRDMALKALRKQEREDLEAGCLSYIRVIYEGIEVELSVARRLREIRAPIAHTDPADYWERKRDAWYRGLGFSRKEGEA